MAQTEGHPVPKQRSVRVMPTTENVANCSSTVGSSATCTLPARGERCTRCEDEPKYENLRSLNARPMVAPKPISPVSSDDKPQLSQRAEHDSPALNESGVSIVRSAAQSSNCTRTVRRSSSTPSAPEAFQQQPRTSRPLVNSTQKPPPLPPIVDDSIDSYKQLHSAPAVRAKPRVTSFAEDTGAASAGRSRFSKHGLPRESKSTMNGNFNCPLQQNQSQTSDAPQVRRCSLPTSSERSQSFQDPASVLNSWPGPSRASISITEEDSEKADGNSVKGFQRHTNETNLYTEIDPIEEPTYTTLDYSLKETGKKEPPKKTGTTTQAKKKAPPRPPPPNIDLVAKARKRATLPAIPVQTNEAPTSTKRPKRQKPTKPTRPPPLPGQVQTLTRDYVNLPGGQPVLKPARPKEEVGLVPTAPAQPSSKPNDTGYLIVPLLKAAEPPSRQEQKSILPNLPLFPTASEPPAERLYGQIWSSPDDEGVPSTKPVYNKPHNDPLLDTNHFGQFVTKQRRQSIDSENPDVQRHSPGSAEETTYVNLQEDHDYCYAVSTIPGANTQKSSLQRTLIPFVTPCVQTRSVDKVKPPLPTPVPRTKSAAVAH